MGIRVMLVNLLLLQAAVGWGVENPSISWVSATGFVDCNDACQREDKIPAFLNYNYPRKYLCGVGQSWGPKYDVGYNYEGERECFVGSFTAGTTRKSCGCISPGKRIEMVKPTIYGMVPNCEYICRANGDSVDYITSATVGTATESSGLFRLCSTASGYFGQNGPHEGTCTVLRDGESEKLKIDGCFCR